MNVRRSGLLVSALLLVAASNGCDSCKKAKDTVDKARKDVVAKVRGIEEAPAPSDLVAELVVKDPEAVAKRAADGMGFGPDVGASPYQKLIDSIDDENVKKGLRAIDPHGAVAAVVVTRFAPNEKPHGVIAAKLKDPELATTALAAASKGGEIKTWDSKILDSQVYEIGKQAEIVVYGNMVILSDARDSIEDAGKYVAWRASKGDSLGHDLVLTVPMDKLGPVIQSAGKAAWIAYAPTDPRLRKAIDPLVEPVLQGIADMGQFLLNVDADSSVIKIDEKLDAKGTFSSWLTAYPAGDASALLTMPKGDGTSLGRFPDGLGAPLIGGIDTLLDMTALPPADHAELVKQLGVLGKSLGHELASANKGSGPTSEFFLRFDLKDPKAGKDAMAAIEKVGLKAYVAAAKGAPAPKVTPYKKFGAEGDSIELPIAAGTSMNLMWAVRGSFLFIGYSNAAFTLVDPGIDPASTSTFVTDATAKAKVATFPTKGVISASFGDTWSFSKTLVPGMGGATTTPTAPTTPIWSYATAGSEGIRAQGEIPLSFIGDLTRFYMGLYSMFHAPPPPY